MALRDFLLCPMYTHPDPCKPVALCRMATERALPHRCLQCGEQLAVHVVPGGLHGPNVVPPDLTDALPEQGEEHEAAQGSRQHHRGVQRAEW